MAVKGSIAKAEVIKRIEEAFGADYVCTVDNKVYVEGNEKGEKIQVAISFTCPKTPMTRDGAVGATVKKSANVFGAELGESPKEEVTMSKKEEETIEELMRRLGI